MRLSSVTAFLTLCIVFIIVFPDNDFWYFCHEKYRLMRAVITHGDTERRCAPGNLCIVSHDTREQAAFVQEYRRRNELYCVQRGIAFQFYGAQSFSEVPVFWRKIFIVAQALRYHEYVMWIDADAHLIETSSVIDMINTYDSEAVAIMASKNHGVLTNLSCLNAGVFIAKRKHTAFYHELVEEYARMQPKCWSDTYPTIAKRGLYSRFCFEEGALNRLFIDHPEKIVPISTCHITPSAITPDTVIVHYMGNTKDCGLVA
jgi:hypothetical protein